MMAETGVKKPSPKINWADFSDDSDCDIPIPPPEPLVRKSTSAARSSHTGTAWDVEDNAKSQSRLPGNRGDSYSYRSRASADDVSLAGRMNRVSTGGPTNFAGVEERFNNNKNLEQDAAKKSAWSGSFTKNNFQSNNSSSAANVDGFETVQEKKRKNPMMMVKRPPANASSSTDNGTGSKNSKENGKGSSNVKSGVISNKKNSDNTKDNNKDSSAKSSSNGSNGNGNPSTNLGSIMKMKMKSAANKNKGSEGKKDKAISSTEEPADNRIGGPGSSSSGGKQSDDKPSSWADAIKSNLNDYDLQHSKAIDEKNKPKSTLNPHAQEFYPQYNAAFGMFQPNSKKRAREETSLASQVNHEKFRHIASSNGSRTPNLDALMFTGTGVGTPRSCATRNSWGMSEGCERLNLKAIGGTTVNASSSSVAGGPGQPSNVSGLGGSSSNAINNNSSTTGKVILGADLEAAEQERIANKTRKIAEVKEMSEYKLYFDDVPREERVCDQPHTPKTTDPARKFKNGLFYMRTWLVENYGDDVKEAEAKSSAQSPKDVVDGEGEKQPVSAAA